MLDRLIIFLVRHKLGLKKFERFRFTNQSKTNNDIYYFTNNSLVKGAPTLKDPNALSCIRESGVSLNWLLNKDCKIVKVGKTNA